MKRFKSGKVTGFIIPTTEDGTVIEGFWQGVMLLENELVSIQDFSDRSVKTHEDAFVSVIEYLLPDGIMEEGDIERNEDGSIGFEIVDLSRPIER